MKIMGCSKVRLSTALLLRIGILDSALYLTQYSIIKEFAAPEDRRGSHHATYSEVFAKKIT